MYDLAGSWRCSSRKSQVCGLTRSRKCVVNLEVISILIWEWGKSKRKTEEIQAR